MLNVFSIDEPAFFYPDHTKRLDKPGTSFGSLRSKWLHIRLFKERINKTHHGHCLYDGDIEQRHRLAKLAGDLRENTDPEYFKREKQYVRLLYRRHAS